MQFIDKVTDGYIYFILFGIFYLFAWVESFGVLHRHKNALVFLSFSLVVLFIGCRWECGTDWSPYKELFGYLELDWTFLLSIHHFDIGYVILNALVKLITDNYTIFLIIDAFIAIVILVAAIIKMSPYPNLSIFLFYTNYMLLQYIGSNRRMIALSIILWVVYYAYNKRNKLAGLCIGSAFLFHRSSIFNLAIYMVPRKMLCVQWVVLLLLISFLIGISQLPVRLVGMLNPVFGGAMGASITEYSTNSSEHMVYGAGSMLISTIAALIKRGVFIGIYCIIARKYIIDNFTSYIFNIYVLSIAIYLIFIGSFFQMLSTYWAITEIILIGRFYWYISARNKLKFLFFIGLFGIFQLNNALNIYTDLYIPYKFIWNV